MKKHKFQNINAGFAIFALSKNNHYADKKFSQILENINKCIDFDQIYIHYDKFKNFSGLAFWAKVSKNTSERLLHNGLDSLKSNEINNGNETWMMELTGC